MYYPNLDLKYRHELKHYVNYHQYFTIRQRLGPLMTQDANANEAGEYLIRSLYFDDINNTALHEKLGGVRDRVKYRIRIYNGEDNIIHFEKKIKMNDYIAKVKESITREMYDEILKGNYEVLNLPHQPLLYEIYHAANNVLLRPKVIVDYVREAYTSKLGNVRITFDKYMKTGLNNHNIFDPHLAMVDAIDHNFFVLEVKYDEYLPDYIKTALQLEGLVRQSNSKYVICRKLGKENSWEDQ